MRWSPQFWPFNFSDVAKNPTDNLIRDGIQALDAGMNSGSLPQLLAPNQTANSTNASHRGGYITHRPVIKKLNLTFSTPEVQQIATTSFFQGASFYAPDLGATQLVASMGGRLLAFTPDSAGGAFVTDISIPGDFNPATAVQAWLWQSERWLIITDGQSLPLFYDGVTTRRSQGPSQLLSTVAAPGFTAPAVGVGVQVPLGADYNGPFNINVLVNNGAVYTILPAGVVIGTTPNATLTTIFDPGLGTAVPAGASILSIPSRIGISSSGEAPSPLPAGLSNPPNNQQLDLYAFPAPTPGTWNVGSKILKVAKVVADVGIVNLFHAYGQNCTTVTKVISGYDPITGAPNYKNLPCSDPPWSTSGEPVTRNIPNSNTLVGTVTVPFATPAAGGSVNVVLSQAYTGSASQVVYFNDVMYLISQVAPIAPVPTVTLINVTDAPGTAYSAGAAITSIAELPPGRMGTYGLGRNWMSLVDGRSYVAGDIVGGSSGTQVFDERDAVLRFTENAYLAGGGAFIIPGNVGDIRFLRFTSTLDVSLGQGPLQVGTPYSIFSCQAPVDRLTWNTVTNPIQTQSLIGNGGLSQNGSIVINGDIIMRSIDGIRSLILARRDFNTWGNVPCSEEVQELMKLDDTSLLQYASAIQFDNRLLMTALPSNSPVGVIHQGVAVINFDPISSLRGKAASIYDGIWSGLNILQFLTGINNGVQRAFAFAYNNTTGLIELWELMPTSDAFDFDNDATPIVWSFETAALFKNPKIKNPFDLMELLDGEIYVKDVRGALNIQAWYRPDNSPCWQKWSKFSVCADNLTNLSDPRQQRTRLGLGEPDVTACDPTTNRPYRQGYNFQFRFQITGSATVMGANFAGRLVPDQKMAPVICDPICTDPNTIIPCEPCKGQGDCPQFPIVFYNFGLGKTYANQSLTLDVTCPNGSVVKSFIAADTVFFSLPYPPGYTGEYPPLILNCAAGGTIIRQIPSGATQDQIDIIANEMVNTCATALAIANAPCVGATTPTTQFGNEPVFFSKPCAAGTDLTYTGVLPTWITLDVAGQQLIGAASTFFSTDSQAAANTAAQNALNTFAIAAVGGGTLKCVSPVALDWNNLVWSTIFAGTGSPCPGDDTHAEAGAVFSNSVFTNTDYPRCTNSTQGAGVSVHATLTYTGPLQTCNLKLTLSGVTGTPDTTTQLAVFAAGFSPDPLAVTSVPFANGVYNFPFTIPASAGRLITVQIQHIAGILDPGGGCIWNGLLTTV